MATPASETDSTHTSPPISTILPSSVLPTQLQNVHHHISEKLTQDNYILWRFLMVPFVEGQNLFSAIISTRFVEALPHVIGLSTSNEVWLTLETFFSAQSQSRIMQLKQQVSTLKKGGQTISTYFQKAQGFSHLLAAVGKPIEGSEVVSHILAGLGAECDPLVTSVTTRQDYNFLNDLYGYMLSYELCLEQHKSAMELNIAKVHIIHETTVDTTLDIATTNFHVVEAVVMVEDHLSNSLHIVPALPSA
ncbi:uncharacterized protein LOC133881351 [Alnus glutinosa]|uniref:uncharacterized protein LOC133881351 n=1 Tax=Alnus glutinosa TaxID=3517 RepID=UPI002D7A1E66|nr:uncharacterized protein LOC133881351 [Alnus glutinosa]